MNQFDNQQGLFYSASNADSIELFEQAINAYLTSKDDVMVKLKRLQKNDPTMPMARCFKAYLMKLASDPKLLPVMDQELAWLQSARGSLNEREKLHLLALNSWANNYTNQTIVLFEQILERYPRDILALRLNHHLHFYSGKASNMLQSIEAVLPHWQAEDHHYSFIQGMHAFALEESGHYSQAERCGRDAVAGNNNDQWAAHAVGHVMHMQGRYNEGVAWLSSLLPNWHNSGNFIFHLHWHQALFYIGLGHLDQALTLYDQHLEAPLADDFYLDVCNGAALLWRLDMLGCDTGDRWQALQTLSSQRIKDTELVFCTLHYLMAPAKLKQHNVINEALSNLQQWATLDTAQGRVAAEVGLPIAQAIVDLGSHNHQSSARLLRGIESKLFQIGGSHAQRQLFLEMQSFAQQRIS